jgi:hypothetical protein
VLENPLHSNTKQTMLSGASSFTHQCSVEACAMMAMQAIRAIWPASTGDLPVVCDLGELNTLGVFPNKSEKKNYLPRIPIDQGPSCLHLQASRLAAS